MIKRAYIAIFIGAAMTYLCGISNEIFILCLVNQLIGCSILVFMIWEEKVNGSLWLRRIKPSSTPSRRDDT